MLTVRSLRQVQPYDKQTGMLRSREVPPRTRGLTKNSCSIPSTPAFSQGTYLAHHPPHSSPLMHHPFQRVLRPVAYYRKHARRCSRIRRPLMERIYVQVVVLPQTSLYVMFYYIGSRSKRHHSFHFYALQKRCLTHWPSYHLTVYTVSLLSTLNAREGLRAAADKYGHASLPHITARSGRSVRLFSLLPAPPFPLASSPLLLLPAPSSYDPHRVPPLPS